MRWLAWTSSNTQEAEFCVQADEESLAQYGGPEIFNTAQGSQCTSGDITGLLLQNRVAISMDEKSAWRDTMYAERLWRSVT